MGQDDVAAAIAHAILCCVSGKAFGRFSEKNYIHPGMHVNFLVHGILGFLNFQSGALGTDVSAPYALSLKASKYLAVPCLMADMYRRVPQSNDGLSMLHLLSGLIPFCLALAGKDNPHLGHTVVALNVISLAFYSVKHEKQWGYYATAAACLAYLIAPQAGNPVVYPLCLAALDYCAVKLYLVQQV